MNEQNFELILVAACIVTGLISVLLTLLIQRAKSVTGRFIISSNPNEDSVFKTEFYADNYDVFYTKKLVILNIVKDDASK